MMTQFLKLTDMTKFFLKKLYKTLFIILTKKKKEKKIRKLILQIFMSKVEDKFSTIYFTS